MRQVDDQQLRNDFCTFLSRSRSFRLLDIRRNSGPGAFKLFLCPPHHIHSAYFRHCLDGGLAIRVNSGATGRRKNKYDTRHIEREHVVHCDTTIANRALVDLKIRHKGSTCKCGAAVRGSAPEISVEKFPPPTIKCLFFFNPPSP